MENVGVAPNAEEGLINQGGGERVGPGQGAGGAVALLIPRPFRGQLSRGAARMDVPIEIMDENGVPRAEDMIDAAIECLGQAEPGLVALPVVGGKTRRSEIGARPEIIRGRLALGSNEG